MREADHGSGKTIFPAHRLQVLPKATPPFTFIGPAPRSARLSAKRQTPDAVIEKRRGMKNKPRTDFSVNPVTKASAPAPSAPRTQRPKQQSRRLPRTLGTSPPPPTLTDYERAMNNTPRTRRALSRAGSVAASVGQGSEAATPKAARKTTKKAARGSDLSAVNLSSSNAYGTGAASQPHWMTGANPENDVSRQINLALTGADHVRDPPRSVGLSPEKPRGRGKKPNRASADVSFGLETSVDHGGQVESSSFDHTARISDIEEEEEEEEEELEEEAEEEVEQDEEEHRPQHGRSESLAGPRGGSGSLAGSPPFGSPTLPKDDVTQIIHQIGNYVSEQTITARIKWWLKWGPVAFAIYFVLSATYELLRVKDDLDAPLRFYGATDIAHNLGQFMHGGILLRMIFANPVLILQYRQLNKMSYDMAHVAHVSEINSGMLETVMKLDFLLVVRDDDGAPQLPVEAYVALRERLRNDPNFIVQTAGNTTIIHSHPDKDSGSLKDVKELVKNERAAREEAIKVVTKDWTTHKQGIKTELRKVFEELYDHLARITVLEETSSMTQGEMQQKFNHFMNKAKLEAFANVKINDYARQSERRINYFSLGVGAIIKPYDTSATYQFKPTKSSSKALFSYASGIWDYVSSNQHSQPNPPREALTKWDEYGDCWCTNAGGNYGYGASLGVLVPHAIYPDQVVIEHIARSASIEPGSTPKDIEIFAFFQADKRDMLQQVSDKHLGYHREAEFDFGFIKVARFTYDSLSQQEVQAFPIQLDLKALEAPTNEIIIRAKNNYGEGNVPFTCFYRVRMHGDRA